MGLLRRFLLRLSRSRRLAERLPRLGFVRRAARRFMPGEEPEDALAEAERQATRDARSLLTLLGENVSDEEEAAGVVEAYRGLLQAIAARGLDAEISVKPTHLGLDLGMEVARRGLERLAAEADARESALWIDMEAHPYVEPTLALYRELLASYPGVGICLQAYLHRTPDDLAALLPLRPAIRLVKGAYAEPARVAATERAEIDRHFVALAGRLLDAVAAGEARGAFGTHDPAMVGAVREAAAARRVAPDAYEIQMLYGIGTALQSRLLREGAALRILISYGPAWFPWYLRRLAERPANLGLLLRELFGFRRG